MVEIDRERLIKQLENFRAYKFTGNPIASLIESELDTVLTDEEEQVIRLTYMDKKPRYQFQIAGELNISDRGVRRRKASALDKLSIALMDEINTNE